jgi:uncharacterized membrane protein YsdA (DUF1294 family)
MLYNILTGYLLIINLVGIYVMWSDKCRAKSGAWRIKEKTLFLVALLGGSLGTTLGMHWFRHKTKHWYFRLGFPVILVAQVAFAMWLRSFFM